LSNLYFWGETYFVLWAVSGISLSHAPDIVIAIKLELLELGFGGSMSTKTQLQEFNSSSFQFLYILLSNASASAQNYFFGLLYSSWASVVIQQKESTFFFFNLSRRENKHQVVSRLFPSGGCVNIRNV
jgi:hypothetical protein